MVILDKYTLNVIENPNIQRLKECLSTYSFTTVWRKWKEQAIPGALSWAPVNDPATDDERVGADLNFSMRNVVIQSVLAICNPKDESAPPEHLPDVLLVDLRTTTAGDADYTALVAAVKSGFGATTPTSPTTYVNFGQFATNFPRNTASFFLDPTSWCRLQLDVTSFKKFIPPTRASSAPNDGPADGILTRYNELRHDARRTLLKGSGEAA